MNDRRSGFTIVELLIVIVIIGILATITILAYNGVTQKAREAALQSDTDQVAALLEIYYAQNHKYPSIANLKDANDGQDMPASSGDTISYNVSNDYKNYCVSTGRSGIAYRKSSVTDKLESGDCTSVGLIVDGSLIQGVTTSDCPATRIRAVDARDYHTYWIQKIGDVANAKCWMLTNLSYAGGGTNTYNDVIPTSVLTNGTGGSNSYVAAKYYVPSTGSNITTEPTNPSIITDGTGQYGYMYNWCAAMGAQVGTSACDSTSTDNWNHAISICPSGWRLPIGNWSEFSNLISAVNAGRSDTDSGLIGSGWLGQRGGYWNSSFNLLGSEGDYWSSTPYTATNPYYLMFNSTFAFPAANGSSKSVGFAVRCVTND